MVGGAGIIGPEVIHRLLGNAGRCSVEPIPAGKDAFDYSSLGIATKREGFVPMAWAFRFFAPRGLRPSVDRVENAALKGRSSTMQEMFVEPEGLAFHMGTVFMSLTVPN